jgi:hypothetical protein
MIDWDKIKQLAKMETFEDVQEFNRLIGILVEEKDPEMLPRLMDLFDDECPHPEVMYGLIHGIEDYPDDIYMRCVLKKVQDGLKNYPEWYERLIYGIFNHEESLALFRAHMHLADRDSLLELFDLMEKESLHHAPLIQELRRELSN